MDIAEMRLPRWMAETQRLDRVENDLLRETNKVTEVSKKIQEMRLHWFEHVMRRDQGYVGRRLLAMDVPGRKRRARPKRRWMECKTDMEGKDLALEDIGDERNWKPLSRKGDPA
ncbi:uncharacterized protein [Palaemon carinicauda]|uniref:uncharacterized protein n=1 Tax=Palaemon carinicauda TaxID=392227 RepID=UPI0035B5E712